MKTYGLRDIIGPVMVGPSSSHTAGALAIAAMARRLCAAPPARASFTLYGSFAHTGRGHGTDKALVAGLLGLDADDLAIRDSFALAEKAGLAVEMTFDTSTEPEHPNTVDIAVTDAAGGILTMRGVSVGGGAAVITRVNGVEVNITGEHTSVVVHQRDVRGVLAHISSCLARCGVNIATASLYRTAKHDDAYTVMETDDAVDEIARGIILEHPAVYDVHVIAPSFADGDGDPVCVPLDAADAFERWNYEDGTGLLETCAAEGCTIAEVFYRREQALRTLQGVTAEVGPYLTRTLAVMRAAATGPIEQPVASTGGLIGGEAQKLARACADGAPLLDPLAGRAAVYALAVLETNAAMGRIVATPTAGSAGVLPAVLLSLQDLRGFTDEQLMEGLLTAGAVGYVIARNASVSGAEGGCQAEVGSAAAMAAAAAVAMAGGTPAQALAAGANVMMSLLGLVCDPVGGLVEVPCQKRNATAASIALVSAQIALSGVQNLISFDEAVAVMDEVGRGLPFELRESALGGIAAAPSACAWCNACC